MEENVALDSKKQKTFVKSIRGIKKLIKKNEKREAKIEPKKKEEKVKAEKPFSMRLKGGKIKKRKPKKERGLVYLSHIPHGFYEHQMTQYFKQFGVVTNARVIKSKRTGNSKGCAFVEFREPSVAQIVAETMNNYLMGKRLIKAVYIPPEKQKRRAFRKNWNAVHNPTSVKRLKLKKAFNEDKDESGNLKKARKLLANLNKTKKRLSELGINYDFFVPVDMPEGLLDNIVKKENVEGKVKDEKETKSKKDKKEKIEQKEVINENKQNNNKKLNKKNNNEKGKEGDNKEVKGDKNVKKEINGKKQDNKKNNKLVKVNEKQQKDKEQKLKDAGVKSVDEFISLEAEDSDDSCDFDSDEYDKILENEDDDLSSGESGGSGDEEESGDEEVSEDDESDEEEVPVLKKAKGKPPPKLTAVQNKKPVQKQQGKQQPHAKNQPLQAQKRQPQPKKQQPQGQKQQPQGKKQQPQGQKQQPQGKKQQPQAKQQQVQQQPKGSNDGKRKAPQKPPVAAKKPKFEKQNQKPLKKQFKKK